MTIHW